jgi:hypothetical protein
MISRIDQFLMQAYLNRELDAQTEADFEIELIRRPELAHLMEADVALATGLQMPDARPLTELAATELKPKIANHRSPTWPNWRIAAVVAGFSVISGMVGFFARQPQPPGFGTTQIAYVDKLRSANTSIQIELSNASPLVLMVPVSETGCFADIDIEQLGTKLSIKAKPDSFGFAAVWLAQTQLSAGTAQINVYCGATLDGSYTLELR